MEFKNPYMSVEDKLTLLERWVIIHSILYYEMDESIVPDHMFDHNARQLAAMLKRHPNEAKQTKYAYLFKGFDGSTGYHLYRNLNKSDRAFLTHEAQWVLKITQKK